MFGLQDAIIKVGSNKDASFDTVCYICSVAIPQARFCSPLCPSFSDHTHKLSLEQYIESQCRNNQKISHRLDQLYSHKLMMNVKESFMNLRFCCLNFLFLTEIYGWPKEMCFLIIGHKPSWWIVPLWALMWPFNISFLVVFTVSRNMTSVTKQSPKMKKFEKWTGNTT